MLDNGVVHDIATALTGSWHPDQEDDEERRDRMVAAARIRIFADGSEYGWQLAAAPAAREEGMGYDGSDWSIGFLRDITTMDNAPPEQDVEALAEIFRDARIGNASATTLAYAVLYAPVTYIITAVPADLKHQRVGDRPERLEIIDPVEAVVRLQLVSGEQPIIRPQVGTMLDEGPHWWLL